MDVDAGFGYYYAPDIGLISKISEGYYSYLIYAKINGKEIK
ncbi:hypothetical protein ACFLSQ_10900 [Bacteroidota bacterium]